MVFSVLRHLEPLALLGIEDPVAKRQHHQQHQGRHPSPQRLQQHTSSQHAHPGGTSSFSRETFAAGLPALPATATASSKTAAMSMVATNTRSLSSIAQLSSTSLPSASMTVGEQRRAILGLQWSGQWSMQPAPGLSPVPVLPPPPASSHPEHQQQYDASLTAADGFVVMDGPPSAASCRARR